MEIFKSITDLCCSKRISQDSINLYSSLREMESCPVVTEVTRASNFGPRLGRIIETSSEASIGLPTATKRCENPYAFW